jgi:alpha-ribazole phosphatase
MAHPRAVWLIRHGQTDWNLSRRYMSHSDRPLTAYGERQAAATGAFFRARKIDVIIHTGLTRTLRSAEAIRGARALPVLEDVRFREASHGLWEGLMYREVMARYRDNAMARFADPVHGAPLEGESLRQMATRVTEAFRDLGTRFAGARVAVVAHGGSIQALLCGLMGTPLHEHWRWRIDAGSVTGVDCYPSTTILKTVNTMPRLITP